MPSYWSDYEKQFLADNCTRMTDYLIAAKLTFYTGKRFTKSMVREMRVRLNLRKNRGSRQLTNEPSRVGTGREKDAVGPWLVRKLIRQCGLRFDRHSSEYCFVRSDGRMKWVLTCEAGVRVWDGEKFVEKRVGSLFGRSLVRAPQIKVTEDAEGIWVDLA